MRTKSKKGWFAVMRNPAHGESSDYIVEVNYSETPVYNAENYTVSECGHFYYWQTGRVMMCKPVPLEIYYDEAPEKELAVLDKQEEDLRRGLEVALDALKARRLELAMLTYNPVDQDDYEGSTLD